MQELKIGTAWVRGVVGDALTPELVVNFACAFGTWTAGGPVVIGRDTRRSSTMLRAAVLAGLYSPGCEVIDLGVCSTPLTAFAVRELGAAGGIVVTGSHNGPEWNALKFIGPDGMLLNAVKNEELLDIYHAQAFRAEGRHPPPSFSEATVVRERYLDHLEAMLDVEAIRARAFRVAVDFCNGSCGEITRLLLERRLGCTLLPLHAEPEGSFPHDPAPTPANMHDLAEFVRGSEAELGAALNIDGDRVAFTTGSGVPLSEEYTLPLAAESRLARRPGLVVTNLSTSRMIEAVAERHGLRVLRTGVGESPVMDRSVEEGAVLAGEGSGGAAALPACTTFDGLLTLGMVLEVLAREDTDIETLAARTPPLVMRKGAAPCPPARAYRILERFRAEVQGPAVDFTDGIRVDWEDAWMHVRASNTEPLLRVIVEAEDEARAEEIFGMAMDRAAGAAGET